MKAAAGGIASGVASSRTSKGKAVATPKGAALKAAGAGSAGNSFSSKATPKKPTAPKCAAASTCAAAASAPQGALPAAALPEPEPAAALPDPDPVVGEVRVKYNHYREEFTVQDGVLQWDDIDEKYGLS